MENDSEGAELLCPFELIDHRGDRLLVHHRIGPGQIDQVRSVSEYGSDPELFALRSKSRTNLVLERFSFPLIAVLRKEGNGSRPNCFGASKD